MKEKISVLIIEDHPMIIEGYKNTLESVNSEDLELTIEAVLDCDSGLHSIEKAANSAPYDILLIDIKLPPSADGSITSGEDLAILAKKLLPEAKIMIITMFSESHRIHSILKNVDPDGFLIKSDLTPDELLIAFKKVLNNSSYYTETVNAYLRKRIQNNVHFDEKSLKILDCIAKGVKTKNLPNHVNLSLSAIERRKNRIKEVFGIEGGDNEELLKEARKRGFI